MKNAFPIFTRMLLCIVFGFSVYGKVDNFYGFNFYVSQLFGFDMDINYYLVGVLIGIEFFLCIFIPFYGIDKILKKIIIVLFVFFCIISLYSFFAGFDSCNCFGSLFEISPTVSLLLKFILLFIVVIHKVDGSTDVNRTLTFLFSVGISFIYLSSIQEYDVANVKPIKESELYKLKEYILIDARTPHEHRNDKLKNSINLPYSFNGLSDKKFNQTIYPNIKNHKILITYCGGGVCSLARGLGGHIKTLFPEKTVYYLQRNYK